MEVSLTGIVKDYFHDVIELEIEEDQEKNFPSNLFSIAESTLSPFSPWSYLCRPQSSRIRDVPVR